jgi:hypothetical protein
MPVVKRIFRFPFTQTDSTVIAAALPGPVESIQQALITGTGYFNPDNVINSLLDQVPQRVAIPKLYNNCPLSGISIAPDSAVFDCDLAVAGVESNSTKHRISPGNPYIGNLDDFDVASISLNRSFPIIVTSGTSFAWDAVPTQSPLFGGGFWGWPLKLNLWYGQMPIAARKRASYDARLRVTLAAGETAKFFMCVDGRSKISVDWNMSTATGTFTAFHTYAGITSAAPTRDISVNQNIAGPTALAAGSSRTTLLTSTGVPFTLLQIQLTDSAGTGANFHQVNVNCFDD